MTIEQTQFVEGVRDECTKLDGIRDVCRRRQRLALYPVIRSFAPFFEYPREYLGGRGLAAARTINTTDQPRAIQVGSGVTHAWRICILTKATLVYF